MKNQLAPISHVTIKQRIAEERLRQARYSFNLALAATAISFLVSLTGAGLLLTGKISEGSVIASGGLVSTASFMQLAKDANDKLDESLTELDDNN